MKGTAVKTPTHLERQLMTTRQRRTHPLQAPDDGALTEVAPRSFLGGGTPLGLVRRCEVNALAMIGPSNG